MSSEVYSSADHAISDTLLAELSAHCGPAWVIEPISGLVVAANAAGEEWLGLRRQGGGARLDAAMPALRRLREIARKSPSAANCREQLVFWASRGAASLSCDVAVMHAAQGEPLILVQAAPEPDHGAVAEDRACEPAPASSGDAATLREIARRIRAGKGGTPPRERLEDPARDPAHAQAVILRDETRTQAAERSNSGPGEAGQTPIEISEPSSALAPDVTAKLAHELKTPLSAIAAAAEIMKDERLGAMGNARYRGYAADIHDSARHALSVVDRILGGSAPDAGRGALEFVQLDANALVESSISALLPLADQAGLELSADLDQGLPRIVADAVSLRQILLNLLANALKFTAAGGAVKVVTRCAADGPITIQVRDTGSGMTGAEIARSLSAPARPGRSRGRAGGLGLGLPLVRSLAEANGARLTIESTPGRGTAATITFAKNRMIPV